MAAGDASWALRSLNRAAAEVDESPSRKIGLRPLDHAASDDLADGYTEAEQELIERYLRHAAVRMRDYAGELSGEGAPAEPGGGAG